MALNRPVIVPGATTATCVACCKRWKPRGRSVSTNLRFHAPPLDIFRISFFPSSSFFLLSSFFFLLSSFLFPLSSFFATKLTNGKDCFGIGTFTRLSNTRTYDRNSLRQPWKLTLVTFPTIISTKFTSLPVKEILFILSLSFTNLVPYCSNQRLDWKTKNAENVRRNRKLKDETFRIPVRHV